MTNSSEEIENLSSYKELIKLIRSTDEDERRLSIKSIPNLVLAFFEDKNELIKQILLLIYNLNVDSDIFESLTLSNSSAIIRRLLRIYMETVRGEYKHEQVEALVKLIQYSDTSELLIELTNVLYHCLNNKQLSEEDNDNIQDALDHIKDKAAANMYPEALLMIHSIMAIK